MTWIPKKKLYKNSKYIFEITLGKLKLDAVDDKEKYLKFLPENSYMRIEFSILWKVLLPLFPNLWSHLLQIRRQDLNWKFILKLSKRWEGMEVSWINMTLEFYTIRLLEANFWFNKFFIKKRLIYERAPKASRALILTRNLLNKKHWLRVFFWIAINWGKTENLLEIKCNT
jgi:hypothetical protein